MADQRVPTTSPDEATKRRMRRVGQVDTAAELAIRRILFARGLRYRKGHRPVPGVRTKADLAFRGPRVAVYIDGCFWHGCPDHATWPKTNEVFWRQKIEANMARDRRIDASLEEEGWVVVRVWEHESPESAAERIERVVRGRVRGS
jgi:DNA mismatch endonuclease, patch repair protein